MELYDSTASKLSRVLTNRYSSSFSASSLLFDKSIRPHIYAIYGLTRIADEIVDTYTGADKKQLLDGLENEVYSSIKRGYSPNPIVHAFSLTARKYGISKELIRPFFSSMRSDINPPKRFTDIQYREYIVGSAEVVGLMCLHVFTNGDDTIYSQLKSGASSLGSAYQKVNFLRDLADDYNRLSRVYFPGVDYESFNDHTKRAIEADIENDFAFARLAIKQLPRSSKRAVEASYTIYYRLFTKLKQTSAETIKRQRVRISNPHKLLLIIKSLIRGIS